MLLFDLGVRYRAITDDDGNGNGNGDDDDDGDDILLSLLQRA